MAKKKKGFIVYNNQLEPMEDLTMEQRGMLFTALFNYHDNGDTIDTDDAAVRMAFKFFKKDIDIDAEKYKKTCEKNSENARLRWDAKSSDRIQADAMDADIDRDRETVKDKDTDKIPSSQEVESFAVEYSISHKKDKQQCIDLANKGWNNYINADWKDVKGNKVKNWKIKLSNSYLSLDKLNDAVDPAIEKYNKSFAWLTTNGGNRMFEDIDFCLKAYNSGQASAEEKRNLENVLKYKKLI